MSTSQRRLVLIEDNPADARLIRELLADVPSSGYELVWANTVSSGLTSVSDGPTDVILLDLSLPDSHGLATFTTVHEHAPDIPIVVLSGSIDDAVAFAAVQAGAQDYLVKGRVDGYSLVRALAYAIERKNHEETQRFLSDASRRLAASLDLESTLRTVAQLVVPFLADFCIVDLVDEQQRPRQAAIVHRDAAQEEALRAYRQRFPLVISTHRGLASALHTGQASVYPDLADPAVVLTTSTGDQLEAERTFGVLSAMFVPLVARGRTLGAICLFTADSGRRFDDVQVAVATELAHRAALALDNAQLYRQANEAIHLRDTVLSSVSHDLRNPLSAIRLIADTGALLLDAVADPRLEPVKEALGRIDANVQRMTAQVEELLDVARLQSGQKVRLTTSRTNLVALARAAINEQQQRTQRHRIVLETSVDVLEGNWDRARLERVLGNLLSNAVKYSLIGGDIAVRIGIEKGTPMQWATIAVQDSGAGIPASDLPRVFSWFFRGRNVANDVPGAGIGLAGSHQIVELHGGTLHVTSEEGVGSTFTVRLPLPSPSSDDAPLDDA